MPTLCVALPPTDRPRELKFADRWALVSFAKKQSRDREGAGLSRLRVPFPLADTRGSDQTIPVPIAVGGVKPFNKFIVEPDVYVGAFYRTCADLVCGTTVQRQFRPGPTSRAR